MLHPTFFAMALACVLFQGVAGQEIKQEAPKPSQPKLAAELVEMGIADQKYRTILQEALINSSKAQAGDPTAKVDPDLDIADLNEKQAKMDRLNQERLEVIIQEFGWPGKKLVGADASEAAFMIVQHSDLPYQEKYLSLLKEAAKVGDLRASNVALLEDRVLMRQGKKQIYGTQLFSNDSTGGKLVLAPIEEEERVDERRKQVGLPPLREYLKNFGIDYQPKKP